MVPFENLRAETPAIFRINKRLETGLYLVGGTLLVCLLVGFFFTPRFGLWRGLYISEAAMHPEVNRAMDTLKQLADPFVKIDNPSNQVIAWRLFFPLLGHYLQLPDWLFLCLPHLGCLLAVGYLIHLVRRHIAQWLPALMAACLLASGDWFMISTGWLAYFDSWFVLGLLLLSFSSSRLVLCLTCLAEPWIDERFLVALPLCFLARAFYQREWKQRSWRDILMDFGWVAALTLPYLGLRLWFLGTGESGSASYLYSTWSSMREVSYARFIEGLWAGFRMAWLYLIVFLLLVRSLYGWRIQMAAISLTAGTISVALVLAGDLSRNATVALPLLAVGILAQLCRQPAKSRLLLPAIMSANLLLPAEHVVTVFKQPVFYIYHELDAWDNPPLVLNPTGYLDQGVNLAKGGRHLEAKLFFDKALRLTGDSPRFYLKRALAYINIGEYPAAREDLDKALLLQPNWPDALYYRGTLFRKAERYSEAFRDFNKAMEYSNRNWPLRTDCRQAMQQLGAP